MKTIYVVTGAYGHLGNTIIQKLVRCGKYVRGLVLENENKIIFNNPNVEIIKGDIYDKASLEALFYINEPTQFYVIHTAGIVSITSKFIKTVYDVNVIGTKNIIQICLKYKVKKFIYVSSVHAIPELPKKQLITEVDTFDANMVVGLYAKTKAKATNIVLNSVAKGLNAVVVHPSGIIGPNDYGNAHLTQLIMDYLDGRLTSCINGGYDFVDVRDVANGCILAIEQGKVGECYILSNQYYTIIQLLSMLHKISGHKPIKTVLPLWIAKTTAPFSEVYYKILKQSPLYTKYSLYTLESNSNFSHVKASVELGYTTRNLYETLQDTINWLEKNNRVKNKSNNLK